MRAVILAAGVGKRLTREGETPPPKCLLSFDGRSLLERHLRLLHHAGVDEVVIAVGYAADQVGAELDRLALAPRARLVYNHRYDLGSMLTTHVVEEALAAGGDVLLMDADVLYDQRILAALVAGETADRVLIDRGFVPGDEPVKLCLRNRRPVELRKKVAENLEYDTIGESVGFFRFSEDIARRFSEIVAGYISAGLSDQPHEEAVRDLLLERAERFEAADVTGLPWLEIDFPADVTRARDEILPRLEAFPV